MVWCRICKRIFVSLSSMEHLDQCCLALMQYLPCYHVTIPLVAFAFQTRDRRAFMASNDIGSCPREMAMVTFIPHLLQGYSAPLITDSIACGVHVVPKLEKPLAYL
jgi:hypothetical protein